MKFKVGDKVNLLNDTGGGEIVRIPSPGKVVLLTEHGFEEIHPERELVLKPDQDLSRSLSIDETTQQVIRSLDQPSGKAASRKKKRGKEKSMMEVDLHIEELLASPTNLQDHDIIRIQLEHCEQALEKAIRARVRKLIIVHGVGKGVLREEVHRLLRERYEFEFYDAPYRHYGFGATEVLLRYS